MNLTGRDLRLLEVLLNYGMLTTQQLNIHVFSGIARTTMLRRLRILESQNLLTRLHRLDSQEHLWILKQKGADELRATLPKRHWSKNLIPHDIKLLSLRIALESSGIAYDWTPEHTIRSEIMRENGYRRIENLLIPDGLMSTSINGIKESIAVELELTQKNKTKLRKTLWNYQEQNAVQKIWYVSPKNGILNAIKREWLDLRSITRTGKTLYCSLLDDVLKNPLEAKVWMNGMATQVKTVWERSVLEDAQGVSSQFEGENHAPSFEEAS